MVDELTTIPNVGPKVAARLRRLGVERIEDLRGADPEDLFARTCLESGKQEDPCLLDTYVAAVDFATTGTSRPWWEYSRERLGRT